MGTDEDIPEDELLNLPSDGLAGLSRLWIVRSGLLYQKQMNELAAERAGTARPFMLFPDRAPHAREREEEERRRALRAYEAAMQEVRDHADRLLLRLDEQQHEIDRRRAEMEGRALHLHDGRRLWIDGDQYRDDSGVILQGTDHEEAEALARERPEAATWGERERVRESQEQLDRLREKIVREREGQGDPAQAEHRLDGYEKELQAQMEQRREQVASADYMSLTSTADFNAAADPAAPVLTAGKQDTEETKKAPRPSGQGALTLR
jgi:hypothetical protein